MGLPIRTSDAFARALLPVQSRTCSQIASSVSQAVVSSNPNMGPMSTAPGKLAGARGRYALPVTTKLAHLVRRTSVVLVAGAVVALTAAPAGADVPEGWTGQAPYDIDTVKAVLIFVGIPLAMFVLITFLTLLPSLVRGERFTVGGQATADQWFGGPGKGTAELPAPDDRDSKAGGASARW
jgi:hypothetical protein